MTDVDLERGYRRWLRCYPKTFRREYEAEILGVLVACAREGQSRPEVVECLNLLLGAVWMWLRPSVPRSDRSALTAIKLMYLGAVVELATAIMLVATVGDVKSNVISRNPGLTAGQWHAMVADQIEPTAIAASIAVGFWLWMAWSIGHGQRWARLAFALFFVLNTYSLLNGLVGGSATYALPDVAIASVLWLLELAAVSFIVRMTMAALPWGARRITTGG